MYDSLELECEKPSLELRLDCAIINFDLALQLSAKLASYETNRSKALPKDLVASSILPRALNSIEFCYTA